MTSQSPFTHGELLPRGLPSARVIATDRHGADSRRELQGMPCHEDELRRQHCHLRT